MYWPSSSGSTGSWPPSRLERAKHEIRTLAGQVRGDRMGLVVFAGEARLTVPLTQDMDSFVDLVDLAGPLSVGRGGTDRIADNQALLAAVRAAHPNATILYKPHPDVEAGLRDGMIESPDLADVIVTGVDPAERGRRGARRARGRALRG